MDKDARDLARFVLIVVFCATVFVLGMTRLAAEYHFIGHIAEIEQLRVDAARVDVTSNEDVMGQVAAWNQNIKAAHAYRGTWWGRVITPEGWDGVNVIEIHAEDNP